MKIFINPGHEPILDPGACCNGLIEAEVTLEISQRVAAYLQAAGCDTIVEQIDGLGEICKASNSSGADLFVSIHCNAADNPSACGTETFCCVGAGAGFELAECIQRQIVDSLPVVDRGVKETNFAVLIGTTCPAVLVETAFVTNENDAELLRYRKDDFAAAIARGITDYLSRDLPRPDVIDHRY